MNESEALAYFQAQGQMARESSPDQSREFLRGQKTDPERIAAFNTLREIYTTMHSLALQFQTETAIEPVTPASPFHRVLIEAEDRLHQSSLVAAISELAHGIDGTQVLVLPHRIDKVSHNWPSVVVMGPTYVRGEETEELNLVFESIHYPHLPPQLELHGWYHFQKKGESYHAHRIHPRRLGTNQPSGWAEDFPSSRFMFMQATLPKLMGAFKNALLLEKTPTGQTTIPLPII